MKPKEYLSQIQSLKNEIDDILAESEAFKTMATGIGNISFEEKAPSSNPNTRSNQERTIWKLIEQSEKLERKSNELILISNHIRDQIGQMENDQYKRILRLRYIRGYKLEQIAIEMGYSYDWVRSRHGRALQAFGLQFPECVKA